MIAVLSACKGDGQATDQSLPMQCRLPNHPEPSKFTKGALMVSHIGPDSLDQTASGFESTSWMCYSI